jgi:hypothetical protein
MQFVTSIKTPTRFGTGVPKRVGVVILVMNCILLGVFVGGTFIVRMCTV